MRWRLAGRLARRICTSSGSPRRPRALAAGPGFEIELAQAGLTLTVPPGQSILEVIEAAGVTVLSSCTEGTCGTCETGGLAGLPERRDSVLSPADRPPGTP